METARFSGKELQHLEKPVGRSSPHPAAWLDARWFPLPPSTFFLRRIREAAWCGRLTRGCSGLATLAAELSIVTATRCESAGGLFYDLDEG